MQEPCAAVLRENTVYTLIRCQIFHDKMLILDEIYEYLEWNFQNIRIQFRGKLSEKVQEKCWQVSLKIRWISKEIWQRLMSILQSTLVWQCVCWIIYFWSIEFFISARLWRAHSQFKTQTLKLIAISPIKKMEVLNLKLMT